MEPGLLLEFVASHSLSLPLKGMDINGSLCKEAVVSEMTHLIGRKLQQKKENPTVIVP